MTDTTPPIPFLNLQPEFDALAPAWLSAVRETGQNGSFILGPQVTAFEREFAQSVGVKHAIGVANGTDSLHLILRALGIGPGDEVITTPWTFFATSESILMVGATPVFADISPDTFCIDADRIAACITPRTRAIMPVHIFGHPAPMAEIMALAGRHGLKVIEDCAQAYGSTLGKQVTGCIGDAGSYSFYPTKVLGGYGDGGMITTNSDDLDAHIRRLRNHGAERPFIHVVAGMNSRLDEIQAAILRLKLARIGAALAGRRHAAELWRKALADLPVSLPVERPGCRHVYNLYTIRTPERDVVRAALTAAKTGCTVCYPQGLHLQSVHSNLGYRPGSLPVCEQASTEVLSLPIYPDIPEMHITRAAGVIRGVLRRR